MPLIFFYLPLIIASGLISVMLEPTHDPDERDVRDPDMAMEAGTIIAFPGHYWVGG